MSFFESKLVASALEVWGKGCKTLQASRIVVYPVHLQRLPSRPCIIAWVVGGIPASAACARVEWQATTKPGVQNPHWDAWLLAKLSATSNPSHSGLNDFSIIADRTLWHSLYCKSFLLNPCLIGSISQGGDWHLCNSFSEKLPRSTLADYSIWSGSTASE